MGPPVFVSDSQLNIQPITAKVVNEPRDEAFLWASLFIGAVTLVVNTVAVIVIRRKERTAVNRLIVFDSFANVLTALVQMLNLMVLTTSSSNDIVCIFNMAMLLTLTTWNRLVPVVLAIFRYLLVSILPQYPLPNICVKVCHPIFVQNQGGEKNIWPKVIIIKRL